MVDKNLGLKMLKNTRVERSGARAFNDSRRYRSSEGSVLHKSKYVKKLYRGDNYTNTLEKLLLVKLMGLEMIRI